MNFDLPTIGVLLITAICLFWVYMNGYNQGFKNGYQAGKAEQPPEPRDDPVKVAQQDPIDAIHDLYMNRRN